jgi:DNA helicase-2/ATP-dependent DNA helicase PcrA
VEGRFDRVDLDPDGATVIDYKTTAVDEPADAARRARESPQLKLYALAYRAAAGVLPRAVELRFVETGVAGRAVPGEEDAAAAAAAIERAAAGIRAASYEPQPSPRTCGQCAFGRICPHAVV